MKSATIAAALLLTLAVAGIVGCAQNDQTGTPSDEGAAADSQDTMRVIGNQTNTALQIQVQNSTEKVISGIAVKPSKDDAYTLSILPFFSKIDVDETVMVCVEPSDLGIDPNSQGSAASDGTAATDTGTQTDSQASAGDSTQSSDQSSTAASTDRDTTDVVLRQLFDVKVTFVDGSTIELHGLNIPGLAEVSIFVSDDGIGYIEYIDTDGNGASTLESERAYKEAADKAAADAAAAAQAQAEADAAAAAQAQADADAAAAAEAQNQYDYNYDYSGGSSGGQSQDQCIPDLVFN